MYVVWTPQTRDATVTNKQAALSPKELSQKIRSINTQLEQFYQYKKILQMDGLTPDEADKEKESRLIVQLRRLEKIQSGKWQSDKEYRRKKNPKSAKKRPQN